MAGYKYKPGTIVNNIKTLLKERYKQGFPIIKEIIQNANDGRATSLDFGVVKGLKTSVDHPLLKTPALFFLNNGTFTKSDREAISCFGIDANAKDKGKIGKFGLGQKSIFHFCEAFFYIARSRDIPQGCGEFINPWADQRGIDPRRPEWSYDLSVIDSQELEKYLIEQNLVKIEEDYFLLWVPLRQRMIDDRCILANYYDDPISVENIFPPDMETRIGQLLPMLRYLQDIRYWVENSSGYFQRNFHAQVNDTNDLQRFIYPKSDGDIRDTNENNLQGNIILKAEKVEIFFAGQEKILSCDHFLFLLELNQNIIIENFWLFLQNSAYWPKRSSFNENAEEESIPDKSIPHCAVVFTKKTVKRNHKASLTFQWSVFLPLASDETNSTRDADEQEAYERINCDGDIDYTVFLHGYFFLDSGRKYIEGLQKIRNGIFEQKIPSNEDEMIAQWNYLLATKGTLKQFLPSLNHFVKTHNLTAQEISDLCKGIYNSYFFKSEIYRESICSDYQWVFRIKPTGSSWELISINSSVRSLPGMPPEWEAFSSLKNLADNYCLIDGERPNLVSDKISSNWKAEEIINILKLLNINLVFSNFKNINYTVKFLKEQKALIIQNQLQDALIEILRKAFLILEIDDINQCKILQELVSFVHCEKRLKIDKINLDKKAVQLVLRNLYQLNIKQTLLIYEPIEPSSYSSNGSLNDEQARSILTCLSKFLTSGESSHTQDVAKSFIEQILEIRNSPESVLNLIPDIPLFFGYNQLRNRFKQYSYLELQQLKREYLIFKGDQKDYNSEITVALRDALPNCEIVFIEYKVAKILDKTHFFHKIPKLDANSCLKILSTKPDLAFSSQRVNLLRVLIKNV